MTRLVLANTLVSGIVTLQGIGYSFTASASGTATGSNVPVAREAAIIASNTAATLAARASIDKILLNNSSVLSDLEITSLISNNFATTVRVFIPIALSKIATTTNGIDYSVDKETTIEADQWLMVPNGQTLYGAPDNPLTNYGYLQLGDGNQTSSGALKGSDCTTGCSTFTVDNIGSFEITSGECYTVDTGVTISNSGTMTIDSGACLTIASGGTFTNNGSSGINNYGTITNYGLTYNQGGSSFVQNVTTSSSFDNFGTIHNSGGDSIFLNFGTLTNESGATISNTGSYASVVSCAGGATFINNGTISNNNSNNTTSSTPTSGTGTCTGRGCNSRCTG